jgi:MFS family permease
MMVIGDMTFVSLGSGRAGRAGDTAVPPCDEGRPIAGRTMLAADRPRVLRLGNRKSTVLTHLASGQAKFVVLCVAGAVLLALAPDRAVALLILSALCIGVGYGPITPASSHVLIRTAKPSDLALTFSIKQTGVPAGAAVAGAILPGVARCWVGGTCSSCWRLRGSRSLRVHKSCAAHSTPVGAGVPLLAGGYLRPVRNHPALAGAG